MPKTRLPTEMAGVGLWGIVKPLSAWADICVLPTLDSEFRKIQTSLDIRHQYKAKNI